LRQLLIYPEILATFRERDIYQGGVFGDGEGGEWGDEEKRKEMLKYKREKMLL
jgi:hypothetical protein